MSEQTYKKVFELIQESLVPTALLEEARNRILHLESVIKKVQSECNDQKLSIEIIQAEKNSLQAEKEMLHAEKKAIEVKFNEVALKLKQKCLQYDALLESNTVHHQCSPSPSDDIEKPDVVSTETKKVKEEPMPGLLPVGLANVPASLSSGQNEVTVKTRTKRKTTTNDGCPRTTGKRKKVEDSSVKSTQSKLIFTCDECLQDWGEDIQRDTNGDFDYSLAPDPRQKIQAFSTFDAYRQHLRSIHDVLDRDITDYYCYANSSFNCKVCDCSFESQGILDEHLECEHANLNMTKQQFLDLYLKHKSI